VLECSVKGTPQRKRTGQDRPGAPLCTPLLSCPSFTRGRLKREVEERRNKEEGKIDTGRFAAQSPGKGQKQARGTSASLKNCLTTSLGPAVFKLACTKKCKEEGMECEDGNGGGGRVITTGRAAGRSRQLVVSRTGFS